MNDETLLRLPAVQARTGYGRTSIYKLIRVGKFPAPVQLPGGQAVAWKSSEISAWINALTKAAA